MRTSLDVTHHGSKDWFPLFPVKDLEFWFLVSFSKICIPVSLNGVLKIIITKFFLQKSDGNRKLDIAHSKTHNNR